MCMHMRVCEHVLVCVCMHAPTHTSTCGKEYKILTLGLVSKYKVFKGTEATKGSAMYIQRL